MITHNNGSFSSLWDLFQWLKTADQPVLVVVLHLVHLLLRQADTVRMEPLFAYLAEQVELAFPLRQVAEAQQLRGLLRLLTCSAYTIYVICTQIFAY